MKNVDIVKRKIKNCIPWQLRLQMQLLLAKHPKMRGLLKARRDVRDYNRDFMAFLDDMKINDMEGKTICELGPGEHLVHAAICYQMGAKKQYLVDIDELAGVDKVISEDEKDAMVLKDMHRKIRELPEMGPQMRWREYLEMLGAEYYTDGLEGYRRVPVRSVDLLYSNTVLQHIRKNIFEESVAEMRRMLKPNGKAYHTVDLKDMIGGRKNHLRFKENEWEDAAHYRMACYTNRYQCGEMCDIFKRNGFRITWLERSYFKETPIRRKELDEEYRGIENRELMTSEFKMVMEKNDGKGA